MVMCALHGGAQQSWFRFNNLSEKQGLSDVNVASIIKDHRGYMWFASSEGLNCYDGTTNKVYHHSNADSNSLSDDNINAIFEDSRHNLWIGTRKGLNLYDTLLDNFVHFFHDPKNASSISSNEIWSIAEDHLHGLWIGTMGGGLNKVRSTNQAPGGKASYAFKHFVNDTTGNNSVSSNIIWSIAFDSKGFGWIGTENGLNRFGVGDDDKITFTAYYKNSGTAPLTDNSIWKVYVDGNNNIWLLSFYGMLDCLLSKEASLAPASAKFIHLLPLLNDKLHDKNFIILSLMEDEKKTLWAGTDKQGLLHFSIDINEHTANIAYAEHFVHDDIDDKSLSNNAVYSLYEDGNGVMWIGTSNGISKYISQKNLFDALRLNDQGRLRNATISAACTYKKYAWFATADNNIWVYDTSRNTLQLLSTLDNFFEITSLCVTERGNLYAGSSGSGIFTASQQMTERSIEMHQPITLEPVAAGTLGEASIFSIIPYNDNNLLIAGFERLGLLDIHSGNFTSLAGSNSGANNLIFRCLAKRGRIFFAGSDNGLFILENNELKPFQPGGVKLSPDRITCLYTDKNSLWIGSVNGVSVYNFNNRSLKNYNTTNGLPDNTIKGINGDNEGNIWITTRNGLGCYHPGDDRFSKYNENESINTNQLGPIIFNGNYLFIGSDKGINTVSPRLLQFVDDSCNIVITEFKIAGNPAFGYPVSDRGKKIKQQQPLQISWNENNISISFSALEFRNVEAIQYAYKLEGFDKDWVYNARQTTANYTNLPGGNYTFRIKYAGSNGVWIQSSIAIPVSVSTAWFRSWWFYALCAVTAILLSYIFYNLRLKRIIELQRMRNKIARDLHDDIGSTLSSINILSGTATKKIRTDAEKTTEMLQKISDSSRRMMDAMGDIVWSINPDNDILENMAVRMKEYAAQVLEARDIDYSIHIDESVMNLKLPLDKRRDFYLVFKEAVNNLAKYASASSASINLSAEGNTLKLQVSDDGKGFEVSETSSGNGLKNMQQRAQTIGGKLTIISSPNNGTSIKLLLPIT